EMAEAVMVQRAAIAQRNADHRLLRRGCRLADRFGHFAGLSMTETGPPLAVADDYERREAKALAALHRLGDAVDVHELLDQLLATVVVAAAAAPTAPIVTPSTIAAAAIEHDLRNARLSGALGEGLAHLSSAIAGRSGLAPQLLVERRGGGERRAGGVIDDLRIDVPARAMHGQPRLARGTRTKRAAHPAAATVEEGEVGHGYFFLPSLRKIYSPRYLMPLPL